MSQELIGPIERWVTDNLALIPPRKGISDHLDYIFQSDELSLGSLSVAFSAFTILVDMLEQRDTPVLPGLLIPIDIEGDELVLTVPKNLQELDILRRQEEPPSLYLVDWDSRKYMRIIEEYRCPLPFEIFVPLKPGVIAFYHIHRNKEAIEQNWGYSAFVHVEYYPARYR